MSRSYGDLSDNEKNFLKCLLRGGGGETDTELARKAGVSVSTANRIRHRFEDEGIIKKYIPVVDLSGVNIELYASVRLEGVEGEIECVEDEKVVFSGKTDDIERDYTALIGFISYEEFSEFKESLRKELEGRDGEVKGIELHNEDLNENFVLRSRGSV